MGKELPAMNKYTWHIFFRVLMTTLQPGQDSVSKFNLSIWSEFRVKNACLFPQPVEDPGFPRGGVKLLFWQFDLGGGFPSTLTWINQLTTNC